MAVLQRSTFFRGRTPAQVLEFCLEGRNFPRIFPEPITPLGVVDEQDLRIVAGREFRFRHWMFGVVPANWTVRIREVGDTHFIDEMLKGPLRAFCHEHRVEAAVGGTLYTDRVTYAAIGGVLLERLVVDRYMGRIFDGRHRNMLSLL